MMSRILSPGQRYLRKAAGILVGKKSAHSEASIRHIDKIRQVGLIKEPALAVNFFAAPLTSNIHRKTGSIYHKSL